MPKPFKAITAIFLLLALVYFECAPTTVQNLDSGEMVANSYGLFVIHPPGYPLFAWLMFAVTHLPFGTVFFRASAFTIVCSLATLWLIFRVGVRHSKTSDWVNVALVLALALTPVYWRYSVLPDVFMLHLFFCALLSYLYLTREPSFKRLWLMSLAFGFGAANHQTILFCLPMLLHAVWQTRPLRQGLLPLATGALITITLYVSLLLMHPGSLHSWGYLQGLGDVWHHFLRTDFGTFQISGHEESHFDFDPFLTFFLEVIRSNPLSLLLIPVAAITGRRDHRIWIVLLCVLLASFGLIPFANLDDVATVERFYLMPTTLIAILAVAVWSRLQVTSPFIGAVLALTILAVAAFNVLPQTAHLNYSHDTLTEDYAQNVLRMTQNNRQGQPNSMLLTQGDTRLFALRYVQVAQGLSPQTILFPLGNAFNLGQLEKLRRFHPEFKIGDHWNEGAHPRSVPDFLIAPNLDTFDVMTTLRMNQLNMQTVFAGIGRHLRKGQGDTVDVPSLALVKRRTSIDSTPSLVASERREMYSEYAFPFLKLGMLAKDPHEQLMYFNQALETVPYCWPALANICVLNEKLSGKTDTECRNRLSQMRATEFNYY